MGFKVKLRQYTADVEEEEEASGLPLGRKTAAALGVAVLVLVAVSMIFSGPSGPAAGHASKRAPGDVATAGGEGEDPTKAEAKGSPFLSTNWGHLEKGVERPAPTSVDTNYECPEWEGIEVYKELKAMAVYDFKGSSKATRQKSTKAGKPQKKGRAQNRSEGKT